MTERAGSLDWVTIVLNFLVVVAGVFLGLQAQEWNQHRNDRAKEAAYLERLASDFHAIDEEIDRCLSIYRDGLAAIEDIADALETREEAGGDWAPDAEAFATTLVRMTANTPTADRSATFVEMLSAGDLNILRDGALRNALVAYDQSAQVNREIWRLVRNDASAYQDALYANVDLEINLDEATYSSIVAFDFDAMAAEPSFRTMLNVLAGEKANNFELCRQQAGLVETAQARIRDNRTSREE